MTFGTLQTELDSAVDDTIDSTKKKRWLNLAYQEVCGYTDLWPFRKASTTITFTSGVGTLPADFSKPIKLYVSGTPYDIVTYQDRGQTGLTQKFYIVPPSDNNDNPTSIGVLPNTVTSGTLEYVKNITELSVDSDIPVFDVAFHEILVLGAKKRFFSSERENNEMVIADTEFKNKLADMYDALIGREAVDQSLSMSTLAQQYNFDY